LDVAGALDALPSLPLAGNPSERARATGTAGASRLFVAPSVAPTRHNATQSGGIPDKMAASKPSGLATPSLAGIPEKQEPSVVMVNPDKARLDMGDTGLEPVTPSVSCGGPTLARSDSEATCGDASGPLHQPLHQNQRIDDADPLAAFVSSLTPEQRARLIALLASEGA
jgi:hypothetical protein